MSVREAFSSLPGFISLDFATSDDTLQQKILLASDNGDITEQLLVKSLGDHAERYVVKGLTKQ